MRNKKSLQTDGVMPTLFRYRFLITLCVLLVAAGACCGSVSAYADVQTAQDLSDALNISIDEAAYAIGNTVYLVQDIPLNYTINITATNPITLTTVDNDHTISRYVSGVPLFNVSSGTLILQGNNGHNLTLDGNKSTYTSSLGDIPSFV